MSNATADKATRIAILARSIARRGASYVENATAKDLAGFAIEVYAKAEIEVSRATAKRDVADARMAAETLLTSAAKPSANAFRRALADYLEATGGATIAEAAADLETNPRTIRAAILAGAGEVSGRRLSYYGRPAARFVEVGKIGRAKVWGVAEDDAAEA